MDIYELGLRIRAQDADKDIKRVEASLGRAEKAGKDAGDGISKGFNKAEKSASGLSTVLKVKLVAALAAVATAAGAAFAFKIASEGSKRAIKLTADLQHTAVAANTTAGEVLKLQVALEGAGASGDAAGKAYKQLRTATLSNTAVFREAGVALQNVNGGYKASKDLMTETIYALSKMEDRAKAAAVAQKIFGREAEAILNLNPDGLRDAARSVGTMADVMDKNAVVFERVDTLLGRIPGKMSGLWVGFASNFAEGTQKILEGINAMDFTGIGVKTGEVFAKTFEFIRYAWEQQKLGELISYTLRSAVFGIGNYIAEEIAGSQVARTILSGFNKIGAGLATVLELVVDGWVLAFDVAMSTMAKTINSMIMLVSRLPGAGGLKDFALDTDYKYSKTAQNDFSISWVYDSYKEFEESGARIYEGFYKAALREGGIFGEVKPMSGDLSERLTDLRDTVAGLKAESGLQFTNFKSGYNNTETQEFENVVEELQNKTLSGWGKVWEKVTLGTQDMASKIDNAIHSIIMGTESIGDSFNKLITSILSDITQQMTKGVGQQLVDMFSSAAGAYMSGTTQHAGGEGVGGIVRRYHTGGQPGERVSITRDGESVLTRDQISAVANSSGGKNPVTVIVALDAKSLAQETSKHPDAYVAMMSANRRKFQSAS